MIVLIGPDVLQIASPIALGVFPIALEWYVSWEVFPVIPVPYNKNQGLYPGLAPVIMTPFIPAGEFVIREVSVFNPNAEPVGLEIGIPGPLVTMFKCLLGPNHMLKYNACPGQFMGWQIFDGSGVLVSADS